MASPIIRALAPATIHKIAAGEVIERPANAVKELVENALDARADKITVAFEEGGMDLIRISDNGTGMTRADTALAWLPHTTSKIREADDLMHVATYGFRGEALCSIAAVAELTIETRHASEETGTSITLSGSREVETREIMRNPGTTMTVKNLFLHSPVRRKFMGTGKTEGSRILGMLSRMSLAHPGISFKVLDKGREVLSLAEGTLKHRVGEILGFNVTNELAPVEWTDSPAGGPGSIHVEGFVSSAQQARLRASHQYFFINRRPIQSGVISRALSQAYDVLPPGRYPMAVLFITLPTEEVDVNVHPTKKEVRFLNESRIYWAVSQAVKNALRKMAGAPVLDLEGPERFGTPDRPTPSGAPESPSPWPAPTASSHGAGTAVDAPLPVQGAAPVFRFADYVQPQPEPALARVAEPEEPLEDSRSGTILPFGAPSPSGDAGARPASSGQLRLFPTEARSSGPAPAILGPNRPSAGRPAPAEGIGFGAGMPHLQIHNSFILFGVQSGLTMVNQQAAHERILYEKALEDLRQPGRFHSQQLLFPEVVEFTPGDSAFLEEHLVHLQALGFDLEAFGGNTFQLRGLPMEIRPDQGRRVMFDLVQGLLRPERGASGSRGEEFVQRLARVYARVSSIKLGEPLDPLQVTALIDGLFATQNPYVSPSGAPVVVRLSLDEIRRKFGLG